MTTSSTEKRLGTAELARGRVRLRLSPKADPSGKWLWLDDVCRRIGRAVPSDPVDALALGRELAHELSRQAQAAKLAPAESSGTRTGETYEKWCDRWNTWRLETGRVVNDRYDRGALRTWIFPVIGRRPVHLISAGELEEIVRCMDAAILAGKSWKTMANAWATLSASCRDMCKCKNKSLVVRSDNPLRAVVPPERGEATEKQLLYPSEYLKLMTAPAIWQASGSEVAMAQNARRWMRAFTLAIYMEPRAGELRALDWEKDVDLAHWTCRVARATKRDSGGKVEKKPKTGKSRRFVIEPNLRPLLLVMHAESGGKGKVCDLPHEGDLSERLQRYLGLAGVARGELFERSPGHAPITFRDLRAVGITWRALRGDDPLKIQSAAGHGYFSTTQIYIRLAGDLDAGTAGFPFPPIPAVVLGRELTVAEERQLAGEPAEPTERDESTSSPHSVHKIDKSSKSYNSHASPAGFESTSVPHIAVKMAYRGLDQSTNDPDRTPLQDTGDPVSLALHAALSEAIRNGDRHAAGQLAAELAARAVGPSAHVLPLRLRGLSHAARRVGSSRACRATRRSPRRR